MSACLLLALALAADPLAPDIPRAVRDLGADEYYAREKATKLLWAAGPAMASWAEAGERAEFASTCSERRIYAHRTAAQLST